MRSPSFAYERELVAAGHLPIGVDEAGCGCLAGPVVAAALHLPMDSRIGDIRDSKLLSHAQRERLVAELRACGATWAIGSASHEEIDRVNIRQATLLAMRRAIESWRHQYTNGHESTNIRDIGDHSWIGAAPFALVDAWTIPNLPIPQRGIIHGDRLVKSIAAASIVAKVTRDAMMDDLDRAFPQYGFAAHRGYATAAHRVAIIRHGVSPVHRLTFCADTVTHRRGQGI